jgi:diketogulonate reductase-like aldo/keto reductase
VWPVGGALNNSNDILHDGQRRYNVCSAILRLSFPLGGFTPLQSSVIDRVAASIQATPMQVALAWLLQRSPNILLIPGTSLVEHLRENLRAAALELPLDAITELNAIDKSVAAGPPMS